MSDRRIEIVLLVIALWLAIAVVLVFVLSGCTIPLKTGFALMLPLR